MDLKKFWNSREPMHRWSLPESALHKAMMGDLVEWIRVFASDGSCPRILDVGCGAGRLFTALSKEGIDVDVTMVDFVDAAITLCKEKTGHKPDKWDGEVLPYGDNEFDLVVMMDFLLHVSPDKIQQVMDEARRVANHYIYLNTTTWNQKAVSSDTWCFSHNFSSLFEGLDLVLNKKYEAKKELNAYLFRVERVEKTLMEAIEEQIDDDFEHRKEEVVEAMEDEEVFDDSDLYEVEREDVGDTDGDSAFSSDESSVPDDREVG